MRPLTILERAMQFAAVAHGGQVRKIGNLPYLLHPMEAAVIAGSLKNDMDVMAAALLHDVVEDTPVTLEQVREEFGDRIADLVKSETEDKMVHRAAADTWKERKELSLKELHETDDIDVKILWLSDKLSNVRSFYRQYLKEGDAMWQAFNQKDKSEQAWYYFSVAEAMPELRGTPAMGEYMYLIKHIFGNNVEGV